MGRLGDEEACVPKELSALHKDFGHTAVWLFRESFDTVTPTGFKLCTRVLGIHRLDVAVARFDVRGFDTQGQDDVFFGCLFCGDVYALGKLFLSDDEMVTGGKSDDCSGVGGFDVLGSESDGGGSIPLKRLQEEALFRKTGQLLEGEICIELIRNDEDVSVIIAFEEPPVGHLQEGNAGAEDVQELFGTIFSAERPQPASDTAGKDYAVAVWGAHTMCQFGVRSSE